MNLEKELEQLYRTDRKKFLGFIRQRVRSQEDAEDILQDVFTNVLAASAHVKKPIENIASWVFTAVRNRIIDSYRKKKAETFSDLQSPGQADDFSDAFDNFLKDNTSNPEVFLYRKTIWDQVNVALEELPEQQSTVFKSNEFEETSFKDMSKDSGTNINTLLARKRYAVLQLRKKLKPLYDDMNDN